MGAEAQQPVGRCPTLVLAASCDPGAQTEHGAAASCDPSAQGLSSRPILAAYQV